jgi:hypothetical protein
MDVMVFTPVYRLEPETVEAVFALEWDGPISYLFQRDNPLDGSDRTTGVLNHAHQYRRGREAFLQSRSDAMLVIESDIIPPTDALKRLAALDVDMAYGVYVFRTTPVVNIFNRYPPDTDGTPARNTGESLSVKPRLLAEALRAGVVECSGAGLGCVLIKRRVLEAVDFRTLSAEMNPQVHCDTWFTEDVHRLGFSMKADMGVLCGHKHDTGEIYWPRF